MSEFLKLKNGNKYPLVTDGFHADGTCATVTFASEKTLEEIQAEFSVKESVETLAIETESGETLGLFEGYVILGSHLLVDTHYELSPAEYGEGGQVTKEAVYGRVVSLSLFTETLTHKTAQNTADIDYLALMTGVELFRG